MKPGKFNQGALILAIDQMRLPILLYHDLSSKVFPSEKKGIDTRSTIVQENAFEDQIRYLKESGYKSIKLTELQRFIAKDDKQKQQNIVLTFDDGHWSNYRIAFPILMRFGFTATFFIIGDRIGKPFHMTATDIRDMQDHGMEIGSHGLTHQHLPELSHDQIRHELIESKKIISDVCGKSVDFFAYSGGHMNTKIRNLTYTAGYKGACSTQVGFNRKATDPYRLRRIEIRDGFTETDFKTLFDRKQMIKMQSVDMVKRLLKRFVGLQRYRYLRSELFRYYPFKN